MSSTWWLPSGRAPTKQLNKPTVTENSLKQLKKMYVLPLNVLLLKQKNTQFSNQNILQGVSENSSTVISSGSKDDSLHNKNMYKDDILHVHLSHDVQGVPKLSTTSFVNTHSQTEDSTVTHGIHGLQSGSKPYINPPTDFTHCTAAQNTLARNQSSTHFYSGNLSQDALSNHSNQFDNILLYDNMDQGFLQDPKQPNTYVTDDQPNTCMVQGETKVSTSHCHSKDSQDSLPYGFAHTSYTPANLQNTGFRNNYNEINHDPLQTRDVTHPLIGSNLIQPETQYIQNTNSVYNSPSHLNTSSYDRQQCLNSKFQQSAPPQAIPTHTSAYRMQGDNLIQHRVNTPESNTHTYDIQGVSQSRFPTYNLAASSQHFNPDEHFMENQHRSMLCDKTNSHHNVKSVSQHHDPNEKLIMPSVPNIFPHASRLSNHKSVHFDDKDTANHQSEYEQTHMYKTQNHCETAHSCDNMQSTQSHCKVPSIMNQKQTCLPANSSNIYPSITSSKIKHKHKEPDKFEGKSKEWRDYIIHFESVAKWNDWNDNEKAQQLVMCLRGPAQKLLSDMRSENLSNYHIVKETLSRRFNPVERETAYRCEFRNRKQKRHESVSEFGYVLQRLCFQAFPGVSQEAREIYVIDQYINGLSRPEVRSHVQYRHPQSIDSAIALAVEFEAFEGSQGILRKPRFEEEGQVNTISDIAPSVNSHNSRSDSVTLSDIAKLIEGLAKTIKRNSSQSRSRDRSDSKERYRNYTPECYNCHEKGHIAVSCPKSKSEN